MSTISIIYTGGLHSECTHLQSGTIITTDAPLDNHGTGASFSPTDLLCNALATCMISIIGIASKTHNFDIVGAKMDVTKIMESNPRKVGEIIVEINFPANEYSQKTKSIIKKSALTCPVYLSLHPDVKKTVYFNYKS